MEKGQRKTKWVRKISISRLSLKKQSWGRLSDVRWTKRRIFQTAHSTAFRFSNCTPISKLRRPDEDGIFTVCSTVINANWALSLPAAPRLIWPSAPTIFHLRKFTGTLNANRSSSALRPGSRRKFPGWHNFRSEACAQKINSASGELCLLA